MVIEEDLCRDLNTGTATMLGLNHVVWEWRGGSLDNVVKKTGKQDIAPVWSSLSWPHGLKECRRTSPPPAHHEEVPPGLGLRTGA